MKVRRVALALAAAAVGASALAASSWSSSSLTGTPLGEPALSPSVSRRGADLTVNITPPAGVYVREPGGYQVVVANVGTKTADAVMLTITLPRTHTSPTVYILGTLGAFDTRCTRTGTNLSCSLGSLVRTASTTVNFTITLPQSSAPLIVGASVTTSSAEVTTTNNNDSDTAYLLHPFTQVVVGDRSHNEHCTGTGLTSFLECELFPSSISSHDIDFLSGGMLTFVNQPATYWGTWSQSAGDDHLVLEYYDGASHEATFDGYAVGNRCFEGVTVFYPPSVYVSPYRVCLQ